MLARIRRKALDASSLISPFGSTHRLIAACKSGNPPASTTCASNGYFAASSRNCCRSHADVSSNEPASRNSAGSSTTPGAPSFSNHGAGSASAPNPNSRSARSHSRPSRSRRRRFPARRDSFLAQVRRRDASQARTSSSAANNSRSLSNSSTTCADRDILSTCLSSFPQQITRRLFRVAAVCTIFPLASPQAAIHSTPAAPAPLPPPLQNRLPEISQHGNGFPHITDLFSISQTTASSTRVPVPLASHEPIRQPYQFKQPLFPGFFLTSTSPTHLSCGRKIPRSRRMFFPPASFAPRDAASIHAAITAAAHREAPLPAAPQLARLRIIRFAFARRELPNTVTIRSSSCLPCLLPYLPLYFFTFKFFHHGHAQSVQRVVHLMILHALVVAQERENQTPSRPRIGIAGKCLHSSPSRSSRESFPSSRPSSSGP